MSAVTRPSGAPVALAAPADDEPAARPAPAPGAALDAAVAADRRRALRTLLRTPLLTPAVDPEGFARVRRHAPYLRKWFAEKAGWTLHVDPEVARLRKSPADPRDGSRPARARSGDAPFSRRRYVLLCLAAAVLERSDRQTALGKLADDIVTLVAGDPALADAGVAFELTGRDQRRDLVAVVRLLVAWGVLVKVAGDEDAYVGERGDALYTISRPALSSLLAVRRGPSSIDEPSLAGRIDALLAEPLPQTDDGRVQGLRRRLVRRLLDDPVVYYDELTDAELDYITRSRGRLLPELEAATGLHAEIRREGIALVDERGDLTDIGLPEEGTNGHVTLLLAEHLATALRERPGQAVPLPALYDHMVALIAAHASHWRRDVRDPGAEVGLVDATVAQLAALRLVRVTDAGVVPLPAIGRYALADAEEPR